MDNVIKQLLEFGPYRLDPEQRLLFREQQPIPLSPKAFDLLLVLVQRSGQVVLKDDLMKLLWPDTFVEESNLGQHVFQLRKALGEKAQGSSYIVTVPGRGYRFAQTVRTYSETESIVAVSRSLQRVVVEELSSSWKWTLGRITLSVAVLALVAIIAYHYGRRGLRLTAQDTVVLADFANSTGDAVFDDTLKQALSVALRQSPFLNILSDDKVNSTLKTMTRPAGTVLTKNVAHEVCQRTASTAYISGSIVSIGSTYVVGLQAFNCHTGETIAEEQATASSKEKVLPVLGQSASSLRRKLGESLSSIQKFDVPLEQATTSSLEALQLYTQSQRASARGDETAALELCSRAVELDPNFARAQAFLGTNYANLGQANRAAESYKKAFALRNRVTDRERFYIEAMYYSHVTGETDRAIRIYEAWKQSYPQDPIPHFNLAAKYGTLGKYNEAIEEILTSMKLEPDYAGGYGVLAGFYLAQNRIDDAVRIEKEAAARNLGGYVLREDRYYTAFLNNDEAGMQAQMNAGPSSEDYLLMFLQAETEAYHGRFHAARDLLQRAAEAAKHNDSRETAAMWLALASSREAEVGNIEDARKGAHAALSVSQGQPVQLRADIALARAGDAQDAQQLATAIDRESPLDTGIQNFYLPTIRAAMFLNNHQAAQALDALKPAELNELGGPRLYPLYLRGIAYLDAGQAQAAAVEFRKMIDHRGIVLNAVIGSLAYLQLGRAQAMLGDKEDAHKSYAEFLELWKGADQDVPILKEAKAEYSKLN